MTWKQGVFEFIEKLVINFYWICSTMKIYIVCNTANNIKSSTNPIFVKFLLLRFGAKCSKPIISKDFFFNHISMTNQWKAWFFAYWYKFRYNKVDQQFLAGHGQKCVWPVRSRDSKIDCISKVNRWIEQFFYMLLQI